jgi:hypothetical protein
MGDAGAEGEDAIEGKDAVDGKDIRDWVAATTTMTTSRPATQVLRLRIRRGALRADRL